MFHPTSSRIGGALALVVTVLLLIPVLLPRLIEADTLQDVAQQRMRLNTLALALKAYALDHQDLPPWLISYDHVNPRFANVRFPDFFLTTPVDYVDGRDEIFVEVFTGNLGPPWYRLQGIPGLACASGIPGSVTSCWWSDFRGRTDEFLNCDNFDGLVQRNTDFALWGPGPTQLTLGAGVCSGHPLSDMPYDPTNGLVSHGHIFRFGFEPEARQPSIGIR